MTGIKNICGENFLLLSDTACDLYFNYAKDLPVIDYHNHLSPQMIAANHRFSSITSMWLDGDHYKWRAMRANGIAEELITGNADDYSKFKAWAATVPYTIGNPLFHWSFMELQNPFGVNEMLHPASAEKIYRQCNEQLDQFTTQRLLKHFNVELLCTTDDPCDSLEHHQAIAKNDTGLRVLPTFRPDRAIAVHNTEVFLQFIQQLETVTNKEISAYEIFLEALKQRHDYFHDKGCRLSDHGIETFYADDFTIGELEMIFQKIISQEVLSLPEQNMFRSATLHFICEWNHEKGWAQQFHVGPLRNTNTRLLNKIGKDAGVDSIGDYPVAADMAKFLDRLDNNDRLTKTILYNVNPAWNEVFASMAGNFQDGSIPGKIQWGAAWWFLDQKDGIENHLRVCGNFGLLSRFLGMLTDSRSFLSFSRHDYFRRILCNKLGTDIKNGELPCDIKWVGKIIQDICYYNAKNYFGFSL